MKNKIFIFIIGVLVGAIITTAGFLIFGKKNVGNFDPNNMPKMDEKFDKNNLPQGNGNSTPPNFSTKSDNSTNN